MFWHPKFFQHLKPQENNTLSYTKILLNTTNQIKDNTQ